MRHRPPIPGILLATAVASLAVAGCGSNSPSSSSSDRHPTQAQMQQDAVRFDACMRSHGVANLPDPTTSPHGFKQVLDPSVTRSPVFRSAASACRHLLPRAGGEAQESAAQRQAHTVALLAFARCMRSHGLQRFPDPTSSGQITHEMLTNAGIDIHQPAVVQTADACTGVTHGVITKAVVARFVAGK